MESQLQRAESTYKRLVKASITRHPSQGSFGDHVAAGLLSLFPTLVHEEHHGKNGSQSIDKESIGSVTRKDVSIASHFFHGDSSGAIHHFPGIYYGSLKKMRF